MRIILGGYFETALVRAVDEVIRPERNATGHPYYLCLNRKVPKSYFDRAATFVALSEQVIVPSIDWDLAQDEPVELTASRLETEVNGPSAFEIGEWDDDAKIFSDLLLDHRALSRESWVYVSEIEAERVGVPDEDEAPRELRRLRRDVAHHYLCRLLLQARVAALSDAYLVLGERDCRIFQEIGRFVLRTGLPAPFSIPDLTRKILDGEDFADGLLNFSPRDSLALAAVKHDAVVQQYVKRVDAFIAAPQAGISPEEAIGRSRELLRAMKEAHTQAEAGRRAEKMFEVATWAVKPLHYVPGLGEVLTLAEDVKDVVAKWVDCEADTKEWYLLSVKMTDIAVRDYLARYDNLIR